MKPPQSLRFDTLYIALSYGIRSIASGNFIIDNFGHKISYQGDMSEAHHSSYTMHPGGTKMYRDVKMVILVEQYEEGHCEVCGAMFNLPTSEGGASETSRDA